MHSRRDHANGRCCPAHLHSDRGAPRLLCAAHLQVTDGRRGVPMEAWCLLSPVDVAEAGIRIHIGTDKPGMSCCILL